MELWQIDGLEYRLFDPDGTKAMIYQLLGDGTRFNVDTQCFARQENSENAIEVLQAAFDRHGVPQKMLSDDGVAFNQSRRGYISNTETFLAEHGCRGIAGRGSHPQKQGKDERGHQTLVDFLDAHVPRSLEQLSTLLVRFRNHYGHRRRHRRLKVGHTHLTPGQAWEAGEHRGSDGAPIDIAQLQANARTYRDRQLAGRAAESTATQEATLLTGQHADEVQPVPNVRLREQPEDLIRGPRSDPQIYYRGRIFKVLTYFGAGIRARAYRDRIHDVEHPGWRGEHLFPVAGPRYLEQVPGASMAGPWGQIRVPYPGPLRRQQPGISCALE